MSFDLDRFFADIGFRDTPQIVLHPAELLESTSSKLEAELVKCKFLSMQWYLTVWRMQEVHYYENYGGAVLARLASQAALARRCEPRDEDASTSVPILPPDKSILQGYDRTGINRLYNLVLLAIDRAETWHSAFLGRTKADFRLDTQFHVEKDFDPNPEPDPDAESGSRNGWDDVWESRNVHAAAELASLRRFCQLEMLIVGCIAGLDAQMGSVERGISLRTPRAGDG